MIFVIKKLTPQEKEFQKAAKKFQKSCKKAAKKFQKSCKKAIKTIQKFAKTTCKYGLRDAPKVDVVPVVRCKDCAYYENCLDTYMIPADCCPQGKRKEETEC